MIGECRPKVLRQQQVGKADDAVEGRPQLVRNVGEKLILRFHDGIELGVQLFESLGRLPDFHRQAPRVVMGRRALAGDGEIGGRLLQCGALIDTELLAGDDAQHAAQFRAGTERHEHEALRQGGGES